MKHLWLAKLLIGVPLALTGVVLVAISSWPATVIPIAMMLTGALLAWSGWDERPLGVRQTIIHNRRVLFLRLNSHNLSERLAELTRKTKGWR